MELVFLEETLPELSLSAHNFPNLLKQLESSPIVIGFKNLQFLCFKETKGFASKSYLLTIDV